jgi:hypothetical protein
MSKEMNLEGHGKIASITQGVIETLEFFTLLNASLGIILYPRDSMVCVPLMFALWVPRELTPKWWKTNDLARRSAVLIFTFLSFLGYWSTWNWELTRLEYGLAFIIPVAMKWWNYSDDNFRLKRRALWLLLGMATMYAFSWSSILPHKMQEFLTAFIAYTIFYWTWRWLLRKFNRSKQNRII